MDREKLLTAQIDIGGRDIFVGFNEPKLKFSDKNLEEPDIDAKLSGRFITYFLPAVAVAKQQQIRPRLYVISGLNVALKWNSRSEDENKIMIINNNLKIDFTQKFFERFFPEAFSIIEFVIAQDPLKIPEEKILKVWQLLEKKYPNEMREVKIALARFVNPKLFNDLNDLSTEAKHYIENPDKNLTNSFKYAISHIFAFGDINFEGNYVHNPLGYLSIGGHQEKYFNIVRRLGFQYLKDKAEDFFGRRVILKDNLKLVLEGKHKAPPAYNPSLKKKGGKSEVEEVTYENGRELTFYDSNQKLSEEMKFMYDSFVPKNEYEKFWKEYRERYFDLKKRYVEAYKLNSDF